MPELNPCDLPLFNSIIEYLFPKATPDNKNYNWLREIFEQKCNEKGFEPIDCLFRKLIEAYELSSYRNGVLLIGNPYAGKSFVLRTLIKAVASRKKLSSDDMEIGNYCILRVISIQQNLFVLHF